MPPDNAIADLLRDARGLRREQQQARDAWMNKVATERKDEAVFELEILLKGFACFGNPRNHPGAARKTPLVSQDFHAHLTQAQRAMARVVTLCKTLLAEHDRAFLFQRYLETVLPEDVDRTRLLRASMAQESPESSLFVLRHGFSHLIESTGGVLRSQRIPFRLFYAQLAVVMREIGHSAFFNPLSALEFRPEFDRISSVQVLELIQTVPGEEAHRLVALTFLSLFRMLRYVRLLDTIAQDHTDKRFSGRAYLVLAVFRSDARALANYLSKRASALLADGFQRALLRVPAPDLAAREGEMRALGARMLDIKAALTGLAANLRLEMRRAFEHDLPAPDALLGDTELRAKLRAVAQGLKPALQNAIIFLGKSLGAKLEGGVVLDDAAARRASSERLRRDVWMFAQIARAFATKARASSAFDERWTRAQSFAFVREFLAYFRAMGYPLLRASDYPRFDAFMDAMSALEDTDLLDPARLEHAIVECEAFHGFLTELFNRISRRDELEGAPFDRAAAARALRLYLGE